MIYDPTQLEDIETDRSKRLDHAADFLTGILDMFYRSAPIDAERVESCLEEIAFALEVDMPTGEIKLEPKFDLREMEQMMWQLQSTAKEIAYKVQDLAAEEA